MLKKFVAVAVAAVVLTGGYSYAAGSVPSVDSDTVIACCGGWGGGNRGMGWNNGNRGGNRGRGGYNGGGYCGGY